ncbi:MAG: phosphoglycerate dehydrogenase [Acidobacteria bacterium RIFCSPLOWO2_12_FULL_54_10]|nr:MAG: phosphoglycerate dehydrogenase [Acidobacteria bacterium RIFCSPLOWO2_12_FULL_54_10]
MKIVVGEKVSRKGVELLRQESKWRIVETEPARDKLLPELKDADALIIRSAIKADAQLLELAPRLQVIGRAGIGVDNVDVDAATRKGVLVMNTPGGNAVSVAEHTLALMLALARAVPQANESMHAGRWEKKLFEGRELQGKTLGIMGLGRIGIEVVKRAHALQMVILAFDPYVSAAVASDLNVKVVSMDVLLERSDYISLHMPGTPETIRMVGREFLRKMKKGACIINCARGELVDEEALAEAVRSGHLAGAALDVFAPEPPRNSPLLALPQVILTPHIAGSTAEAQEAVGLRIAEQVRDYLKSGVIHNAVNVPAIPVDEYRILRPYLDLGERLGLFLAQVAPGPATEVEIRYAGKLAKMNTNLVRNSVLKGLLNPVLDEKANIVNAVAIAEDRGIRIEETRNQRAQSMDSVRVALKSNGQEASVEGTILHGTEPRLVVLDGINVECPLDGNLIVLKNQDIPGVVGKIGTILGSSGINIANFSLGRERPARGKSSKTPVDAVAVVQVDGKVTDKVLQVLSRVPAMRFVRAVHL